MLLPAAAAESKIREFDVQTIEKLGKELYRRDTLAASASDLLLSKHPEARRERIAGWITQPGKSVSRVFFLQKRDDGFAQAYVAIFEKGKAPAIESHLGEAIPEEISLRYNALQTGKDAVPRFYDRPYNFEVLDDPDGSGFLVYALAATKDANEMVIGGHYRISVSADSKKAEAVDALSATLFTMPKRPEDLKGDENIEATVVTHVVSKTPVETHGFVSLLYKRPFLVVTGEHDAWRVEEGNISRFDLDGLKSASEEKPGKSPAVTNPGARKR